MGVRRVQSFELDWEGQEEVIRDLDEVADRMTGRDPIKGWQPILRTLEAGHAAHFLRLRARYVRTGATRASLTMPQAPGAIRRIEPGGEGVSFGTSVWYAHFLTKAPRDPADGQPLKGRSGKGRSAVLSLTPKTRQTIAAHLLRFITEPVNEQELPHSGWAPGLKIRATR